jgi:hypothetical protein
MKRKEIKNRVTVCGVKREKKMFITKESMTCMFVCLIVCVFLSSKMMEIFFLGKLYLSCVKHNPEVLINHLMM